MIIRTQNQMHSISAENLKDIAFSAADCTKCRLADRRNSVVFGEGPVHASLMVIGEAPGADEDIAGRPFVGRAGTKLMEILKAIDLDRHMVYITNILKCRPPKNRDPSPDEVASCIPYLHKQISVIRPKVILALGNFAAKTLTKSDRGITSIRGRFYTYAIDNLSDCQVMPTYHPSYVLRNPGCKRDVWNDVKQVRELLNKLVVPPT